MPVIKVRDNEPFEVAMKRFKKQCEKAGILSELKRREYYDKPSVRKKKKAAAAAEAERTAELKAQLDSALAERNALEQRLASLDEANELLDSRLTALDQGVGAIRGARLSVVGEWCHESTTSLDR